MGNSCCGLNRSSSSMVWAADDGVWTSPLASSIANKQAIVVVEKKSLLGLQNKSKTSSSKSGRSSTSTTTTREVKINISKKQLQELLRRAAAADVHNITVDQLALSMRLPMNASDHHDIHLDERPWRPVLQTIPEIN